MAFAQDPNALSILLRNQPQIPQQTEQDAQLASMIPDEQLFQAQDAIGRHGAESGGAYSIPSREALKQSGMAELRKLFGMQQAEAQAKAYPNQVTGEYGLANRRLQNQGALEVARANEEGKTADIAAREAGMNSRATASNTAAGERAAAGRASAEGIANANRTGRMDVAHEVTGRAAANQAAIANRAHPPGIVSRFIDYLSGHSADQNGAADPVQSNVHQIKQRYPGVPLHQLIAQGMIAFDSPEEAAATQAAFGE